MYVYNYRVLITLLCVVIDGQRKRKNVKKKKKFVRLPFAYNLRRHTDLGREGEGDGQKPTHTHALFVACN